MSGARLERTGNPHRLRTLADGGAIYQVPLSAGPDRDWRSQFLEQEQYALDFVPALVRFTYHPPNANFQSEECQLRERLRLLDLWIDSTNQRFRPPPRRSEGERQPSDPLPESRRERH